MSIYADIYPRLVIKTTWISNFLGATTTSLNFVVCSMPRSLFWCLLKLRFSIKLTVGALTVMCWHLLPIFISHAAKHPKPMQWNKRDERFKMKSWSTSIKLRHHQVFFQDFNLFAILSCILSFYSFWLQSLSKASFRVSSLIIFQARLSESDDSMLHSLITFLLMRIMMLMKIFLKLKKLKWLIAGRK